MAKGLKNRIKLNFEEAVLVTPDIVNAYKIGLQALQREHRKKIVVSDLGKLGGSVDIDAATTVKYPNASRWDYVLDYDGQLYFVEIHSANSGEISTVLRKLQWLKDWLNEHAPELNAKKATLKPYHWLQSSNFNIPKGSSYYRQIAQAGLMPKAQLVLPIQAQ